MSQLTEAMIINALVLAATLEADLGSHRTVGLFRLLRTPLTVALVIPLFLQSPVTRGNGLLVELAGVAAGLLAGLVAATLTRVYRSPKTGKPVSGAACRIRPTKVNTAMIQTGRRHDAEPHQRVQGAVRLRRADPLLQRDGVARGLIRADGFRAVRSPLPPAVVECDPDELAEAVAEQLIVRWGVVFRDLLARENIAVPWREVLWALRRKEARGTRRVTDLTATTGGLARRLGADE